jgi:hypothetical protein
MGRHFPRFSGNPHPQRPLQDESMMLVPNAPSELSEIVPLSTVNSSCPAWLFLWRFCGGMIWLRLPGW